MKKNYVNYHVLISHSPSCLNRDDMNMQKTAVFGGVNRVRISSQALKRAMRTSDYYREKLGSRSTRTRFLVDDAVERLKNTPSTIGQKDHAAIEAAALIVAALVEGKTKEKQIREHKRDKESGRIQHQVVPFNELEMREMGELISVISTTPSGQQIDLAKKAFREMEGRARAKLDLDVALSGRMAASDLSYRIDGALAVAHAITTHAVQPQDLDWFTAVDDLTQDAGETGAGHLDTQQFSAGVFYRYASLNLKQLQVNLGSLAGTESVETESSRKRALEIASDVLYLLAMVVPTGKQQSFAAHNPAEFALVTFADQPISLANAFEVPVKPSEGYLRPSISALADYWSCMNKAYGLEEDARAFSLAPDAGIRELQTLASLAELQQWVRVDTSA